MPTFGLLLPARLPEATGAVTNVATPAALVAAIAAAAPGSIINVTSNLNGAAATLTINCAGSASQPIMITQNPGVLITNYSQWYVTGSHLRFRTLNIGSATIDNIKITSTGNNVEIDGCNIHNAARQGILVSSNATSVQIWNNTIHNNGSAINGNLDHGIYFSYARGNCVIANNLFYDNYAYNLQVYPDSPNVIVTCNTLDGGTTRGGMVVGSEAGLTINVKVVGCIGTNAPYNGVINPYLPAAGYNDNAYDSLGFGNSGTDFPAAAGWTFTNCLHGDPAYVNRSTRDYHLQAGSTAIGFIQASRYGYVPPTDITGTTRITADAGCYAYASGSPAPSVAADTASSITTTTAQLNGRVSPNGTATTYVFHWGTTPLYGTTTAPVGAGSGSVFVAVNTALAGLTSGTTYHYQVQATSSAGTSFSNDMTFTTVSTPPTNTVAPVISGSAVVGQTLLCSTGTWTGTVTSYAFQWQRETGVGTGIYADLGGDTARSHICVNLDVGLRLRCRVTAT